MITVLIGLAGCLSGLICSAQGLAYRDSLQRLAGSLPEDTNKVVIYIKLASYYATKNKDSALMYAEQAGVIARRYKSLLKYMGYKKKVADIYFTNAVYDKAIEGYNECIRISSQMKDSSRLGKRLLDLAGVYRAMGELDTALNLYLRSLPMCEKFLANHDDTVSLSIIYFHLSDIYTTLEMPEAVLFYAKKSYAVCESIDDELGMGYALYPMANYYQESKPALAKQYIARVREIAAKYDDPMLEMSIIIVAADMLIREKKYQDAVNLYKNTISLIQKDTDPSVEIAIYSGLAQSYLPLNDLENAELYVKKGIALAEPIHRYTELKNLYLSAIKLYQLKNNFKEAFFLQKKLNTVLATLSSDEVKKNFQKLTVQYKTVQKDKELAQKQLQLSKKDLALQIQSKWLIGILSGLLLVIIIAVFLYAGNKQKHRLQKEKLRLLEKDKEIQILDAMMSGEEKERTRIARDLHDGIGGMLSGVKMHFSTLKSEIKDPDTLTKFTSALKLLDATSQEVRKTAHNMMPEMLLKYGLNEALSNYCKNIGFTDAINIHFQAFGTHKRYKQSFELSVYRIVQELINNIIKHSNASEAIVQLSEHEDLLTLVVEDNGIGFNSSKLSDKHGMGLNNLKSRISAMNGNLEIDAEEGSGTTAHIEFNTSQMVQPTEASNFI